MSIDLVVTFCRFAKLGEEYGVLFAHSVRLLNSEELAVKHVAGLVKGLFHLVAQLRFLLAPTGSRNLSPSVAHLYVYTTLQTLATSHGFERADSDFDTLQKKKNLIWGYRCPKQRAWSYRALSDHFFCSLFYYYHYSGISATAYPALIPRFAAAFIGDFWQSVDFHLSCRTASLFVG